MKKLKTLVVLSLMAGVCVPLVSQQAVIVVEVAIGQAPPPSAAAPLPSEIPFRDNVPLLATPSVPDKAAVVDVPVAMQVPSTKGPEGVLFGGGCARGILEGKLIPTDCSTSMQIKGDTVCFSSDIAKVLYLDNPESNLDKSRRLYEEMQRAAASK